MKTKNLAMLILAAAAMANAQVKMPSLSNLKSKMTGKEPAAAKTTAAPPAAAETPASQPAPTTTAASSPAPAPASPAAADSGTAPTAVPASLPPGPMKGVLEGQGIELTMCEKGARDPQSKYDIICATPARTFAYKGSVTNVFGTLKFTPALTNESVRMKVMVYKNGTLDEYREITFQPGGRTAAFSMTKTPGLYTLKLVDQYADEKVGLTDQFVVMPDTVGDRAIGNVKSGIGKLMVCSTIDDNWKCLNESTTWAANKPFNLYVRLPEAISGEVCGWEIFKQNPDGTDGIFVEDMMQGTQGRAAYWATTGGHTLPAGTYTIYSIAWSHRATVGNLTSYFAKTTLTVR